MDKNFIVEITAKDGSIITLDTNELDINIYQKCNGESVRVLEISGSEKTVNRQLHLSQLHLSQLHLSVAAPDDLDESSSSGIEIDVNLSGSLITHSFK